MNLASCVKPEPKKKPVTQVSLTGGITVTVKYQHDRISQVDIENTRPLNVTRFFEGKPVEQVLALMPSLFYICGMGQQIAALRAVESAQSIAESSETKLARDVLTFAERLREQTFSWVTCFAPQEKSRLCGIVDWFNQCKRALSWSLSCNPVAESLNDVLHQVEAWQAELTQLMPTVIPLDNSAVTIAELGLSDEQLALLSYSDSLDMGAASPMLNLKDPEQLNAVLTQINSEGFCQHPCVEDAPCETGSWARQRLLTSCNNKGELTGPLSKRVLAIYHELRTASDRLKNIADDTDLKGVKGCGLVETSRGTLLHKVVLDETTQVQEYRIVAPTEWNFHPNGTLATMLKGVEVERHVVEPLTELLIKLLDPCVSWQLEVEHA